MADLPPEFLDRAERYAASKGIAVDLAKLLGWGTDGAVWRTKRRSYRSAVKVFEYEKHYVAELRCYQRLREKHVDEIEGLAVPKLVGWDHALMVIEMTVVNPPHLLDFAKSYVDERPDYTQEPEIMETWEQDQIDRWGEDWPRVRRILSLLEYRYGIYYPDCSRTNIKLDDE